MGKTPHTNTSRSSLLIQLTRPSAVIQKPTGYAQLSTSTEKCVVKLLLDVSTVVWVVDFASPTPRVVLVVLAGLGAILFRFAESVKGQLFKPFKFINKKNLALFVWNFL